MIEVGVRLPPVFFRSAFICVHLRLTSPIRGKTPNLKRGFSDASGLPAGGTFLAYIRGTGPRGRRADNRKERHTMNSQASFGHCR